MAVKDPVEICGIQSRQFPNESAGLCLAALFQELNSVVVKGRHKIVVMRLKKQLTNFSHNEAEIVWDGCWFSYA